MCDLSSILGRVHKEERRAPVLVSYAFRRRMLYRVAVELKCHEDSTDIVLTMCIEAMERM